ncbi:hypothetical protein ACIQYF_14905 [Pseudomonas sp. NPDC096917]|uniref:hypothetical protein n=1 Tax=Pseudomonas sp. NPDC096917 TaxID=3364483 RepID=UPI00383BDFB2
MLRASLLANADILPQAKQGSYFFNRIGRFMPIKAHPVGWSDAMQTTGQVECKWLVSGNAIRHPATDCRH